MKVFFMTICVIACVMISGFVSAKKKEPSCTDRKQNQDETDEDCGGVICPACDIGQKCETSTDCSSLVCDYTKKNKKLKYCQPSCFDGILNQDETDVDCGGVCATLPAPQKCADSLRCLTDSDCTSNMCTPNAQPVQKRWVGETMDEMDGKKTAPPTTDPYGTCQSPACFPDTAQFLVKTPSNTFVSTNVVDLKIGDKVKCVLETGLEGECDVYYHYHTPVPYTTYLNYPYRRIESQSGAVLHLSMSHLMWFSSDVSLVGTESATLPLDNAHFKVSEFVTEGKVIALRQESGLFKFELVTSTSYNFKDGINLPIVTGYATPIVDGFVASSWAYGAFEIHQSDLVYRYAYEWQKVLTSNPAYGATIKDASWVTYYNAHFEESFTRYRSVTLGHLANGEIFDSDGFATDMKTLISQGHNFANDSEAVFAIWETFWVDS